MTLLSIHESSIVELLMENFMRIWTLPTASDFRRRRDSYVGHMPPRQTLLALQAGRKCTLGLQQRVIKEPSSNEH